MASLGDRYYRPVGTMDSSISSTPSISSSSSAASAITPTSPLSASSDSSSNSSVTPLWKTLVRPRPWRFVQRSRIGGSLDRERARQEDTSLDDDQDSVDARHALRSALDGEELTNSTNVSDQVTTGGRTKSESDINVQKVVDSSRHVQQVGFKTRAQRFSIKDEDSHQPPGMSGSHTLPRPGKPRMKEAYDPNAVPLEPALVKFSSLRRSRSSGRTSDGPKTVKFTEPERQELSPTESDKSSDKSDSPNRNITLNVHDTSVRVSFSKPTVPAKPVVPEKSPTPQKNFNHSQKPEVPAKPARLSSSFNGPTLTNGTNTRLVSQPTEKPSRLSSSDTESSSKFQKNYPVQTIPKSPEQDVLFTMGFTIADTDPHSLKPPKESSQLSQDTQRKPMANETQPKPGDILPATDLHTTNTQTIDQSNNSELKKKDTPIMENVEKTDRLNTKDTENTTEVCASDSEVLSTPLCPERIPEVALKEKKLSKSGEKEIIPKKMIKIKGDKKAEEKAAKAKKKEQKAKEKELKSKKKGTSTEVDTGVQEKGRVKLFSWKVEFSAKEKSPPADTTANLPSAKTKDTTKKKEPKKGKQSGPETAAPVGPSAAETAAGEHVVQPTPDMVSQESVAAASSKKADKGDGSANSSSTSSRPSSDRKDPSPSSPPPDDELQHQQQQQEQQQQHREPQPSHRQPSSPSLPTDNLQPFPQQQQQQQQQRYQQQPPRQPTPRPRYFDDLSSSDQNSDIDSLYGSLRRNQTGKSVRICESDGEVTPGNSHHGHGRRLTPRRHTVGGAQIKEHLQLVEDTDRKREAFYEMLASRYPQYADKITGLGDYAQDTTASERSSRPREPQRRRTAVAMASYSNRSLDYDDPGTMSDIEVPSFQRGGIARASLPIVRSASTSLERPIGLVFLVYRDETKKALLPNEITSLDTVRALFVRAFPEKLSMEFLDSPKRKIYILEASTSIFFQLEDLRDIHDRTVLKIHECESAEPQVVKSQLEIRGRNTQPAAQGPRPASRQGLGGETSSQFRDEVNKVQSLPMSTTQNFQDLLRKERAQWEMEQEYLQAQLRRSRSRSQTPEPAERPRSLSTGAPRTRYSHSPDRLPTPDRAAPHLNTIPENPRMLANGFRQTAGNGSHYEAGNHPHLHHPTGGHAHPPVPGRVLSPTPVGQPVYDTVYQPVQNYPNPQSFVSHSVRTAPPQGPLRATGPPPPDMKGNVRGGPSHRQSPIFAATSNPVYDSFPQQHTQPYRVTPERDALPPRPHSATPNDMSRMERMEAQIASLAAWVHQVQMSPVEPLARRGSSRSTSSAYSEGTDIYPGSSASKQNGESSFSTPAGLSDIPAAYSVRQPVITTDMRERINDMHCRMQELRVELQGLRRMEQLNQEAMRDAFSDTLSKLKKVISAVPGAENQVIRQQRLEVSVLTEAYMQDKVKVEKELSDLETSVEELKEDVLNRKCRINISDIEGLALALSNITKSLADLKARFPQVNESLKKVMSGEMEIVVKEEKFIKDEPQHIEAALKRCKQLTSTLYTLKRLATVQDTQQPQVPSLALESKEVGDEEKMAVLESIRAMVPDHATRVQSLEAADASRERKKKIVTQQESLKFTKSLQTASKSLKPPDMQVMTNKPKGDNVDSNDAKRPGSDKGLSENKRTEQPEVPAKPARLMLPLNQTKASEASSPTSSIVASLPVSSVSHTVTVTSQMADGPVKKTTEAVQDQRNSARSAFFRSLQPVSPSHSDGKVKPSSQAATAKIGAIASLGTVLSSATVVPSSTSLSYCKPLSSVYRAGSPTRTQSSLSSSIPVSRRHSDSDDPTDKIKKVPPPPPPRKSSAKFPFGIGPLSPQSTDASDSSKHFAGRRNSSEKSPDDSRSAVLTVYKTSGPTSPTVSGPLSSSTPKPVTPQKPHTKKSRPVRDSSVQKPDLQLKKSAPERVLTTFTPPVPAAVVTNSQDPIDEGDLSGSESTGSSTSLDSQQGVALIRANSCPSHRGPKPHPPQRHSSLGSKGSEDSSNNAKTHAQQERVRKSEQKPASAHLNGLSGVKNEHKTGKG